MAIDFPQIDPVIIEIGPVAIRWYAISYILGLVLGLKFVGYLLKKYQPISPFFNKESLDDLFAYVAFGVILGGRLGYVIFYKLSTYLNDPLSILKVWEGGMSFHGGLVGVILAIIIFSIRRNISPLMVGDYVAPAVPIGLFFGRIANFINGELYGRVTDVAWAVRFPDPFYYGQLLEPRHPSQIYEAFTEGFILFIVMLFLINRHRILSNKGMSSGIFMIGYGISRIFCEFFREPDHFLGFILQTGGVGLTQGMILSVPMIILGTFFFYQSKDKYA